MKKVMTFGTFDILHPGHIHMLNQARQYGDFLVIVVACDITVREVKGKDSVYNQEQRVQHLVERGIADKVRLGYSDDKYRVIREEQPNVIALGYDQTAFVDKLWNVVDRSVKIIRLEAYQSDRYKSSLLRQTDTAVSLLICKQC